MQRGESRREQRKRVKGIILSQIKGFFLAVFIEFLIFCAIILFIVWYNSRVKDDVTFNWSGLLSQYIDNAHILIMMVTGSLVMSIKNVFTYKSFTKDL